MSASIDLNADLGESMGTDAEMFGLVTSASIACGGHAGDTTTMRRAVQLALEHGVTVGAHPGYPDKANFGRVRVDMPARKLTDSVARQISGLVEIAAGEGAEVKYVKLHGALANISAVERQIAAAAMAGVAAVSGDLIVLALAGSEQVTAAGACGLRVVAEGYADRAYRADGTLVPRRIEGAMIEDPAAASGQAVRIAVERRIVALDGTEFETRARSICLHGDTPGAVRLARAVRDALQDAGVTIEAFA